MNNLELVHIMFWAFDNLLLIIIYRKQLKWQIHLFEEALH